MTPSPPNGRDGAEGEGPPGGVRRQAQGAVFLFVLLVRSILDAALRAAGDAAGRLSRGRRADGGAGTGGGPGGGEDRGR